MFYLAAFESVLAIRDIALNMSACGSKRKESRPSPSLSLSPPSLAPLFLSRPLLLSLSLRGSGRDVRFAALERERERRASLREIGGEVRFAAERGASLRERETEKAALRRAPGLLPFHSHSILTQPLALRRVLLSFNDVLVRRARNPNHGQEAGCAYLAHSCACVCVLRVCLRICADVCVCVCVCVCLCFACVPADLR